MSIARAAANLNRWMADPVIFVREVFHAEPDAWQCEVLRAFPHHKRIAMKACKNPGKTAVLAWCAWLFILTRKYCKIIATSVTGDNLSDGLWSEMSRWQRESKLLTQEFEWGKTMITKRGTAPGGEWFMAARRWKDSASPEEQADTLAGKHADYMLFILDEVGAIPEQVMVAAEAALGSGIETKLLIAGNPTKLEGPLYRACTTGRNVWKVFEITGDPDDPNRAPRVDLEWAKGEIAQWGRDNPWVMANVLGKFPPSSLNALLGPDEVTAAMRRNLKKEDYEFAQRRLGIDCARFGDDSSVIFPRQGLQAFKFVQMRNADGPTIASRVAMAKARFRSEAEFFDDTGGWAASAIDFLIQGGGTPIPVNFSGKPDDPRYLNKRAEIHFRMAQWVKRGGGLPFDPDLHRQLTAITYTFNAQGKFQIEEKEQMKKRLGFSPDKADALALTFTHDETPTSDPLDQLIMNGHMNQRKVEAEYDVLRSETHHKEFAESDYNPIA